MNFPIRHCGAAPLACALVTLAALASPARADVLDDVKSHGGVKCGVTLAAPGFSAEDNAGKRTGFDIDLCRAIAAAALGDDSKIQLQPMDLKTAFASLPSGAVDVLTHRFTWTQSRDVGGLKFPKVMFFDGQGFAVTTKSRVNKIGDLNNATICTAQGSTSELIVADYFRARKLKYKIVTFASQEQAWDAFVAKRCDAAINDRSGLAARLAKLPNRDEFKVLAETVSNEPIGPIVAQGQPRWEALVRFTLNALVAAEELGINQGNVDAMLKSESPDVQRLLGVTGDFGSKLGVGNDYAYKAVKAVGNYGEVWDRNVGPKTPLRLERGRNALVANGGLMMAVPVR
ncbi:amino acid ABC transporter substrate-binding protein [Ramlibacter alkalitolerans]|uniref:Amino acid ABC transporter substrate-binding protein n=1 Tax=Ramlibacter alkalitolerans TaxID=2039631 RepID=A0ABS1JSH0_9BURK|nr:amino acid ABC transporter substrate-binding protein [Ramlibacter alkalitolerans]MBL0427198.1 amino acid ABC transporter substrate-binding protein [Ramlibacter alkalitolerans]